MLKVLQGTITQLPVLESLEERLWQVCIWPLELVIHDDTEQDPKLHQEYISSNLKQID